MSSQNLKFFGSVLLVAAIGGFAAYDLKHHKVDRDVKADYQKLLHSSDGANPLPQVYHLPQRELDAIAAGNREVARRQSANRSKFYSNVGKSFVVNEDGTQVTTVITSVQELSVGQELFPSGQKCQKAGLYYYGTGSWKSSIPSESAPVPICIYCGTASVDRP